MILCTQSELYGLTNIFKAQLLDGDLGGVLMYLIRTFQLHGGPVLCFCGFIKLESDIWPVPFFMFSSFPSSDI